MCTIKSLCFQNLWEKVESTEISFTHKKKKKREGKRKTDRRTWKERHGFMNNAKKKNF